MTLTDIYQAVDELAPEELTTLQEYIEHRKRDADVKQLQKAFEAWQGDLSEDEIDRIEAAMNGEKLPPEDFGVFNIARVNWRTQ